MLEALRERGWALGGEQSGHIIDCDFVPSGDGIAAALLTLEALGGDRPRRPRTAMRKLPAAARERAACATAGRSPRAATIARPSSASPPRSRAAAACCVRPSGTEPLVRVMVEAPTAEEADSACDRLVAAVERAALA